MIVNVAPVFSRAARSWSGQFHRPTPKPISFRRLARQAIGLSRQSISAQAASVNGRVIASELDHDPAVRDLCRVGAQVLTGWRRLHLTGPKIEDAGVLRTFDGVFHHEPVG